MNDIQKFMQIAVGDQIKTAGEEVEIVRPKHPEFRVRCKAVITSRDGSFSAAVGGAEYSVTGHALIQKSSLEGNELKVGDNIEQESGEIWIITNTISSNNDAGISCDLVRKQ